MIMSTLSCLDARGTTSLDYVPGPEHADYEIVEGDEDDDVDIEADEDEEEEHPALADSVVVALPTTDQAPSAEEIEPFETGDTTTLPLSVPTSSPPLLLPSASRREEQSRGRSGCLWIRRERLDYGITESWDWIVDDPAGATVVIDTEYGSYFDCIWDLAAAYTDIDSDADITGTSDHTTGTSDSTTGIGYRTTGIAGTRWGSCIARAARGGW
ncbi:hypothetical protein Tco_0652931 [Tanacetum coccineum]|uniref:Uncharacterized protein n=1 Tax=Tanacetum coccineum TaxID=301880 RepID=A0ABQ4WZ61_9ASTR